MEIFFVFGMLVGGLLLGSLGGFEKYVLLMMSLFFMMGISLVVLGMFFLNGFVMFVVCCVMMGFLVLFYSGV